MHLHLFTYIVQTNLLEHSSPLRLPKCGGWGPKLAKIEVCKPFQFSCSITKPFSCSIKCKPFQFNSVASIKCKPRRRAHHLEAHFEHFWGLLAKWWFYFDETTTFSSNGPRAPPPPPHAKIDLLGQSWHHLVAGGSNWPAQCKPYQFSCSFTRPNHHFLLERTSWNTPGPPPANPL